MPLLSGSTCSMGQATWVKIEYFGTAYNPAHSRHLMRESKSYDCFMHLIRWPHFTGVQLPHRRRPERYEKPWLSYTYAATVLRLRLPLESGVPAEAVSVQPFRWESSAVIAGMPSCFPMARQDKPSSSRSRTTSDRKSTRLNSSH